MIAQAFPVSFRFVMMTFEDFLPRLEHDLQSMSERHRLAFSAACCERAVPNFAAYARDADAVDAAAIRQAMDEVWEFLAGRREVLDVAVLRDVCEGELPPDNDPGLLAPAAADAVQMLDLLLGQFVNPRAETSKDIAQWAETSIDCYLRIGPMNISDNVAIAKAGLMQRELSRQAADLTWLKGEPALDSKRLELFRSQAAACGGSLAAV